jgi:arylformamidase
MLGTDRQGRHILDANKEGGVVDMGLYRGMDRVTLDAGYNNSAAVPGVEHVIAEWAARSEELRRTRQYRRDLSYGPGSRNTLDWFPAGPNAPVLVYIHGGYWQRNAKDLTHFVGAAALPQGIAVAHLEYTLCPAISMTGIAAEIGAALDYLQSHVAEFGGDPRRMVLTGHSAGGHLAAVHWAHPAITGVLPISGLFELEPIRLCYLNDPLQLTTDEVATLSPIRHIPRRAPPMRLVVGGAELSELRSQTGEYAAACRAAGHPVEELSTPRHDHFSILEELARPDGRILAAVTELLT